MRTLATTRAHCFLNSSCHGSSHMISHTLPHSLMCTECGKVSLLHSACAVEEEFNEKVEACVRLGPTPLKSCTSVVCVAATGRARAAIDLVRAGHDALLRPSAAVRTGAGVRARESAFLVLCG